MLWCIAVLAAGVAAAAADDVKADLAKLEGSWEITSVEAGGKKAGAGAPDRVVFKDGKATFYANGEPLPTVKDLRLDLDPKQMPKAVNLVRGENETLPCIRAPRQVAHAEGDEAPTSEEPAARSRNRARRRRLWTAGRRSPSAAPTSASDSPCTSART
jgi:uncharacterized protein (TIGR03067 family)